VVTDRVAQRDIALDIAGPLTVRFPPTSTLPVVVMELMVTPLSCASRIV